MLHQCSFHDVECMAPSEANIKFMNENLTGKHISVFLKIMVMMIWIQNNFKINDL